MRTLAAALLDIPGADWHALDVAPTAEGYETGGVGDDVLLLQLSPLLC